VTGSFNTFIGATADGGMDGLTNATAIGYGAIVGASNSLVLGGTGANAVNVGIGTVAPSNVFRYLWAAPAQSRSFSEATISMPRRRSGMVS